MSRTTGRLGDIGRHSLRPVAASVLLATCLLHHAANSLSDCAPSAISGGTEISFCTSPTPDGGNCTLTPTSVPSLGFMVEKYTCRDGDWTFASDDPVFIGIWQNCRFTPPDTLHCDGQGYRAANGFWPQWRLPTMDARLKHVSITGYLELTTYTEDVKLPNVVSLNLSHNSITLLRLFPLQQRSLQVVDLSHNKLTSFTEQMLPPFGNVRQLYLQGNPLAPDSYAPLALHAAMEHCIPATAELPRTWLSGTAFDVPHCTLTVHRQHLGEAVLDCARIQCDGDEAEAENHVFSCGDSRGTYKAYERCNGAAECSNLRDETNCEGDVELINTAIGGDVGVCATFPSYIKGPYVVHGGMLLLDMVVASILGDNLKGQSQINTDFAAIPSVETERSALSFSGVNPIHGGRFELSVKGIFGDNLLAIVFNAVNLASGDSNCSYDYSLGSPTTTTPLPMETEAMSPDAIKTNASATATVAASISVAILLLVVAVTFGVLWRQRQQTTRLLGEIAGGVNKLTPKEVLAAAKERFYIQFAPLLSADADARYQALLVQPEQLHLSSTILGQGAFGTVCLGALEQSTPVLLGLHAASGAELRGGARNGIVIACKTTPPDVSGAALTQLLLEARLHACLKHRNLVALLAVQEACMPVMLALEYCSGGDLRQELRRMAAVVAAKAAPATLMVARMRGEQDSGDTIEAMRRDMAAQVAAGVQYLHSKLCIHRDVAARNVLLVPAGTAGKDQAGPSGFVLKLADLGLSRVVCDQQDYYRSRSDDAVPIRWQCPIAVTSRVYTAKSDVYSFGVLLWEIYSGGATPFGTLATAEVVRAVQAGERLQRPSLDTPEDVMTLIWACTTLTASARPSMASVHARLKGAWSLEGGGGGDVRHADAVMTLGMADDNDSETAL